MFQAYQDPPFHLDIGSKLDEFKHCKDKHGQGPFIVPPTWNKTRYYKDLQSVWHHAAKELASAENIFVSGYSLPESDLFFRYLFALGTIGEARLRRFWVFDPDKDNVVENRFKLLLGPDTEDRFDFFRMTFEKAITKIGVDLGFSDSRREARIIALKER